MSNVIMLFFIVTIYSKDHICNIDQIIIKPILVYIENLEREKNQNNILFYFYFNHNKSPYVLITFLYIRINSFL